MMISHSRTTKGIPLPAACFSTSSFSSCNKMNSLPRQSQTFLIFACKKVDYTVVEKYKKNPHSKANLFTLKQTNAHSSLQSQLSKMRHFDDFQTFCKCCIFEITYLWGKSRPSKKGSFKGSSKRICHCNFWCPKFQTMHEKFFSRTIFDRFFK